MSIGQTVVTSRTDGDDTVKSWGQQLHARLCEAQHASVNDDENDNDDNANANNEAGDRMLNRAVTDGKVESSELKELRIDTVQSDEREPQ